jgi:small conductance mechanosensitive channel
MNAEKIGQLLAKVQPSILGFLMQLALAVAVFIVGRWFARFAKHYIKKAMTKAQVEPTLTVFASNILFYIVMAFVLLAALGAVGIETTSLIAVLGAAFLAVGLSLQGSLANFAAGIIIIIFHPFRVGDWVEVDGHSGYITEIELLTTIIQTLDNRTVIIPNVKITENSLVNHSTLGMLRLDLVVGVDYGSDIDQVKKILLEALTAEARVLTDPAPKVGLLEMTENRLNFAVRPWVAPQDYLPLKLAIQEAIKKRLDAEGIHMLPPPPDVHLLSVNAAAVSQMAAASKMTEAMPVPAK